MLLTNDQLHKWGEEYRRLRHALPPGTTFEIYVYARDFYRRYAHNRLRDWHQNPRVMPLAGYRDIILN